MASLTRHAFPAIRTLGVYRSTLRKCVVPEIHKTQVRTFLPPHKLKTDLLEKQSEATKKRYADIKDTFKATFLQKLNDEKPSLLTEDFVLYLMLAEKEDLEGSLDSLYSKYQSLQETSEETSGVTLSGYSKYTIEPVIVRKLYIYGMTDEAIKFYRALPESDRLLSTSSVVLDLLYESGRYEECLDIALETPAENLAHHSFPMGVCAAYRVGTFESLQKASKLYDMFQNRNDKDKEQNRAFFKQIDQNMRRLLALHCNDLHYPRAALKLLLDQPRATEHPLDVNIKAVALLSLCDYEEAYRKIQHLANEQKTYRELQKERRDKNEPLGPYKSFISLDTFQEMEKACAADKHAEERLSKLLNYLRYARRVTQSTTASRVLSMCSYKPPRSVFSSSPQQEKLETSAMSSNETTDNLVNSKDDITLNEEKAHTQESSMIGEPVEDKDDNYSSTNKKGESSV